MKLGFIGTGSMGGGMAANLIKAGHHVKVHDIRKAATDELVNAGANWAASPQEASVDSDVVLLSLPGPPEMEDVVLGERGVLRAANEGSLIIDTTTNSPALIRKIAVAAKEKGVDIIDAPVSGGTEGAKAGTLTIMVGGDKRDFDRSLNILKAMGKTIVHVGELGMGAAAKLIHNMLVHANMEAIAEGMALGAKIGMDLDKLFAVLSGGMASSRILTEKYPRYGFRGNFRPGGTLDIAYKDMTLATALGREAGVPLYMGPIVLQRIIEAQARGFGSEDVTANLRPLEELLNVQIRVKDSNLAAMV